jgi:hypothetical protein
MQDHAFANPELDSLWRYHAGNDIGSICLTIPITVSKIIWKFGLPGSNQHPSKFFLWEAQSAFPAGLAFMGPFQQKPSLRRPVALERVQLNEKTHLHSYIGYGI